MHLKPIIDAHRVAVFRLYGRRNEWQRGEELGVGFTECRGEEVSDKNNLLWEKGFEVEIDGGDKRGENRPVGYKVCG